MARHTVTMSGISHAHGGIKTDAVETVSLEELEIRQASTSLHNILDNVDRPDKASNFQLRYTKYLSKVEQFFNSGHNWEGPNDYPNKVQQANELDNYQQFEQWLLMPKADLKDLNFLHEKWLTSKSVRHLVSDGQEVKYGQWMAIFFNYTNFKKARPLVRSFTFIILVVKTTNKLIIKYSG